MENFAVLVPLVILVPLIGAMINLFLGKRMGEKMVGLVGTGAAVLAFLFVLMMFVNIGRFNYEALVIEPFITNWITIPAAGIQIPWQFRVDTLSLTMMMIITGIGSLIHFYSIGYMTGDSRYPRFFVYLNLFLMFMLILVTGNNFLVMFVGWEGVGLMSFLLIGFWFDKKNGEGWRNSNAARKAFIANRVGDFGILLAVFLTFWTFGTLDYYKPGEVAVIHEAGHEAETSGEAVPGEVVPGETHSETTPAEGVTGEAAPAAPAEGAPAEATPAESTTSSIAPTIAPIVYSVMDRAVVAQEEPKEVEAATTGMGVFGMTKKWMEEGGHTVNFGNVSLPFETVVTLIALLMIVGVTGKSAQIPLFIWLPDAMAGPTPVSALIHAATMVTAGIYLVTRSNVIFYNAPLAGFVLTMIGSLTAVMAGFVAVGQWDIKKVLAYSTVSQLGFMVAAIGLGGYAAGMFHLITHAFFKACLFLGSGSVIHAMEHGHHHVHAHGAHGDSRGDHADAKDAEHKGEETHGDDAHSAHGDTHEHEEVAGEAFDPQDMRNMGGLAQRMPVTFVTYLVATLALSGIFPLSGFWSKDEIIGKAFTAGFEQGKIEGFISLVLLLIAAGFTAFYMWRQIRLVFLGAPRTSAAENAPESSVYMTAPLVILALLSLLGGLINLPLVLENTGLPVDRLTLWLEESVQYARPGIFYLGLAIFATAVAVVGILGAEALYARKPLTAKGRDRLQANPTTRGFFRLANAKLYWDEIYTALFVNPYIRASKFLANTLDWELWHNRFHEGIFRDGFRNAANFLANPVDRGVIDRLFLLPGRFVNWIGGRVKPIQTGYVRTYAFTMLLGVLFIILIVLLPLLRAGR